MRVHRIYRRQHLQIDLQQAWDFFTSPHFLNSITPNFFRIDIRSPVPDKIYGGLLICYRLKAVFGFPMTWISEISHCDEPHRFVYRQLHGPFKFWSHEVCLIADESGIVVEDIVFYGMPFGLLGELFHSLFIGARLQRIFSYRAQYLQAKWGVS